MDTFFERRIQMIKEEYEPVEMEIIELEDVDIITGSNETPIDWN